MKNRDKINYTKEHRKAFLLVEKQLLGKNTLRGYLHDIDKLFLYRIMDYKKAHQIHRKFAKHHIQNARSTKDYINAIIDWECARYTKADKPLPAREYYFKIYKKLSCSQKNNIERVLFQLHL